MPSLLSALGCVAQGDSRSSVPAHRLAEVGDHLLRDLGLRRTDLYALPHLHRSRAQGRLAAGFATWRSAALAGRRPAPVLLSQHLEIPMTDITPFPSR